MTTEPSNQNTNYVSSSLVVNDGVYLCDKLPVPINHAVKLKRILFFHKLLTKV